MGVAIRQGGVVMEKRCGCKGVRSCLLCEAEGQKSPPEPLPALSFTQCHRCGELFPLGSDVTRCPMTSCTPKRIWSPVLSDVGFDGVTVVQDFVTPREEEETVRTIDQHPWAESQSGRRKQVQ